MSLFTHQRRALGLHAERAFSLTELLVVSALALLVGAMLLSALFFANRMWQITQAKIHSADKTRQLIRLVGSHVHSARILRVGSGGFGSFAEAPLDTPQQGNALQIHSTTDTNAFIRYYLDSGDKKLKYMTNGSTVPVAVAKEVINGIVFRMEDFQGNVLTSKQNNCVIGLTLDFAEIEGPGFRVGPGQYYQSFRVTTKVAQRTL